MRSTYWIFAVVALVGILDMPSTRVEAKGLSNRHPGHELVIPRAELPKRDGCKANSRARKAAAKSSTASAAVDAQSTTSRKTSKAHHKKKHSHKGHKSAHKATQTASASTDSTASATGSSSAAKSAATPATEAAAGAAPPNSPWGNCFELTATAFQPNWKGEATTTWCGVEFDKSSPILALPLADLSKAYGSDTPVTYYSNEALWRQMVGDWCGREVTLQGPSGPVKAYFGDANTWSSVDLNMNVFTKLKGVATGSYSDPDAAGWMNGIKGCFSGSQISIKSSYPFNYN